ncbi:hypothetical protein HD599_002579 [Conyzicola lurida]|uniref:Transcriptional regulator, AbiEi antitoxin, Type IV TA system n=1 Tax=Conyzicola lurida TaxID=1172621 RepID=A0A841ARE3_9MICO|nr:hypothetical protein [Conyzicola lurida]MBB5844256.1 hypothetical protein [Conyzicola lurida]
MTKSLAPEWRDEFVLSRDVRARGRISELLREVRTGILVPVTRGAFRYSAAVTADPDAASDDAYLAKIRAIHLLARTPPIFSSFAAAAVWQLPMVGGWPDRVTTSSVRARGGRSNSTVARSYVGERPDVQIVDGLRVTTLARTVADVARHADFGPAVALADSALHGQRAVGRYRSRQPIGLDAITDELTALGAVPGAALARGVCAFANGASGSAGESISRVGFHVLGLPMPLLQTPFRDALGLIGYVDFWWPHLRLIGEFDGQGKYLRDEYTAGKSAAQVVMEEKRREDRLRALDTSVTRWGWDVAQSLPHLRDHLAAAGLR